MVTQRLTAGGIVKGVLFGTSSAQMYYLLVYAQLVMLTPLLYRVLRSHRLLVYCVTPVFLLVREVAAIVGVALPQVQVLFPAWLLFYVLGLDWGEGRTRCDSEVLSFAWAACRLFIPSAGIGLCVVGAGRLQHGHDAA